MVEKSAPNNKLLKGVGIFLLLFGFAMAGFGVWFIREAGQAQSWPEVTGKVINVSIKSRRSRSSNTRQYHAVVTYSYNVEGKSFTSSRYRLGDGPNTGNFNSREKARKHSEQWKAGDAVKVYYNPESPDSAVLAAEASWGVYVPSVLGGLCAILGFVLLKLKNPA